MMTPDEDEPLRVCFVCDDFPPGPHGGIGSFVHALGRGLVAEGHRVTVVGVYEPTWPAPDHHVEDGIEVVRLRQPAGRFGWLRARVTLWREIKRIVASGRADIVEVPDYRGWAAGWRRLPVPVVARCNGSATYFRTEMHRRPERSTRRLERWSIRRADAVATTSTHVGARTQEVLGLRGVPMARLPNPVEAQPEPPAFTSRDPKLVVFAGTLTPKKGIVELVSAWPAVVAAVPDAMLEIWGKDGEAPGGGSMRGHLVELVASSGISTSVQLCGTATRPQLFARLRRARVAVYPSHAEAFAIAPIEAMSLGCPTVYTSKPPGPELIDHEVTGLLVDPDRPATIAPEIVRLLLDDALAVRVAEAGYRHVLDHLTVDRMLAENLDFYRRSIKAFAGGSDG